MIAAVRVPEPEPEPDRKTTDHRQFDGDLYHR
jgi:hypothetical protein